MAERNWFELSLSLAEEDRLVFKSTVNFGDRIVVTPGGAGMADFIRDQLERFRVYHFHDTSATEPIKRTADLHDNRYLRDDGSNLAAFLYRLRQKEEESYRMIVRTVRLVAPFFEDFVLEPQALNEDKIRLEWRHRGYGRLFRCLIALRWLTEVHRPGDAAAAADCSAALGDSSWTSRELGLHPYAITLFCSLVKQCSSVKQIVLATQSPTLVDHFEPGDVLVADRIAGRNGARKSRSGRG